MGLAELRDLCHHTSSIYPYTEDSAMHALSLLKEDIRSLPRITLWDYCGYPCWGGGGEFVGSCVFVLGGDGDFVRRGGSPGVIHRIFFRSPDTCSTSAEGETDEEGYSPKSPSSEVLEGMKRD